MTQLPEHEQILIFDFGSQYGQLIARRVREQNVFCQLVRHDLPAARVAELRPKGLIFSGGPASVYEPGAPHSKPAPSREFGRTLCRVQEADGLFAGVPDETVVWMSHGDQEQAVNGDFVPLA